MLWLMLCILWSFQLLFRGAMGSSPAVRVLWYCGVLLGILHAVVTTIELIEFVLEISSLG